tara:strand:- start:3263 stop:4387 length:1125 start_codon:yes stop_codon:yes gene_type:complete
MTKAKYYQNDVTEEEKERMFMRLCPEKRSTFKKIFIKIKKISSVPSIDLDNFTELNLFIQQLQVYMKMIYEQQSKDIIINGKSFSDVESVKKKVKEIIKKEKRTPEERRFVRDFIRYHPEITKSNNDLYRNTKKIERIIFKNNDIFLKLENEENPNNLSKVKIYNGIARTNFSIKKPVEGNKNNLINLTTDDKKPRGFEISLTDCNNFLINFLKEYYTKEYKNPKKLVFGKLDNNKPSLLVQDVYDNFVKLEKLKDIFDKDKSKYCQGYLVLNEQGNFTCSFCNHIVVKNTINIAYPTYDKTVTSLKDATIVESVNKLSRSAWIKKKEKDLQKQIEQVKDIGGEILKKAQKKLKNWNNSDDTEKRKKYEKYKKK